tara:strand:- start:551 stop:733 length:183 start_codon:yes stop_codon:yes gene_type:complete
MSVIKINKAVNKQSRSFRVTLLWLVHFSFGWHCLNGYHFNTGVGVGPFEISGSLHTWEEW